MIYLIRKMRYAALVGFMVFAASCGGGGGGGSSTSTSGLDQTDPGVGVSDTGEVAVFATDAETDQFREINLSIIRAELLGEGGRELLFEGEKTINLLALANVTELLSVSEVPTGTYNKIRLTLTQIELVFHDEERPPVYPKLPGNGKLDINPRGVFYVDSDKPLTIQLDFDAEKSIHIVGTGNGKYKFRPVVFTKEVEHKFDTKLIRQTGVVRNLSDDGKSFDLCLIESQESDEEDCVRVVSNGDTTIFDSEGESVGPGSLENGAIVTVVGHLSLDDVSTAATDSSFKQLAPSGSGVSTLVEEPVCEEIEGQLFCGEMQCEEVEGQLICDEVLVCDVIEGELFCEEIEEPKEPLCKEIEGQLFCGEMQCEEVEGQLICDDVLVCDDVEGELVCEEIEEPKEPLCKEVEGQLICDGMTCEEVEGQLICEGTLVCDDFEGELVCEEIEEPEEPLCKEVEGQLICDEMECEEVKGELICEGVLVCEEHEGELVCEEIEEEEEKECFEFEGKLVCEEHCEEIEGKLVCEDDSDDSGDDEKHGKKSDRVVLLADIIWMGDNASRTENVACGPVVEDDVLGRWYQNAELDGEVVPECNEDNSRPTILLPGARIYDKQGIPKGIEAIQSGVINVVDGIPTDSGLKAMLVIVEPSAEEDSRGQLSGIIGVLEVEALSLITELGDRCVTFDDDDTAVYMTGLDEEGHIVFSETSVTSLAEGQRADAFGEQNVEGCLEAETLIIEAE